MLGVIGDLIVQVAHDWQVKIEVKGARACL
jgi:hypothetical protein